MFFSKNFLKLSFWAGKFFRFCALGLVSEKCIVSNRNKVVEVKPMYMLLFSAIQCPYCSMEYIYIYIYIYI